MYVVRWFTLLRFIGIIQNRRSDRSIKELDSKLNMRDDSGMSNIEMIMAERTNAEQKDAAVELRNSILTAYANGERNFSQRNLCGIDLNGCDLSGADLSGCALNGAQLQGAILRGVNLTRADLTEANLSRADLTGSDLSWGKLSHAEMVGAKLNQVHARAANFSNVLMIRARLNDADCLGANFYGVNATAAQLDSANLECADLTRAAMMNASLCGANCSWANLSDARLNWANLSWSLLEATDLEFANLTGVNLRAANLSFANLHDAILTGADLYFANLSGACLNAEHVQAARVSSVRLTSQTYSRSGWSRELLREWQQKGAVILDFSALSKDVQNYIREGDCNLRIYFSIPITFESQLAVETLMAYQKEQTANLRILSISNEDYGGYMAFYSTKPADVEAFISALHHRIWQDDPNGFVERYMGSQKSPRVHQFDIIQQLNELSAHILQIQALVPISDDDLTKKLQARLCKDSYVPDKAQISWSHVSLPKVER